MKKLRIIPVTLLTMVCLARSSSFGQTFLRYGVETLSNQIELRLFDGKAADALVDGVNEGRNASNVVVGGLNFALEKIPSNPLFEKPGAIGYIKEWDPDSIEIVIGTPGRKTRRYVEFGRFFNGGRSRFTFGQSSLNTKYPSASAQIDIFPIEILRREQLFGVLNLSRIFHFGFGAEVDFANSTLIVPKRELGINLNADIVGQMIQATLYYRHVKELPLPYLTKPKSMREKYAAWGASVAVTLAPVRYTGEQLPPYVEGGVFAKLRRVKTTSYVDNIEALRVDAVNGALSATEAFNRKANEVADAVGVDIYLSEDIDRMKPDTVEAINRTRVVAGRYLGLRYDEKLASLALIFEQSPKVNLRGELGLYPLFWSEPFKLFELPLIDDPVYFDLRKAVEFGGFIERNWNIDKRVSSFLVTGTMVRIKAPLQFGRRIYAGPYLTYSRIKKDNKAKLRVTELEAGIKLQFTLAKRYALDKGTKQVFDREWENRQIERMHKTNDPDKKEEILERIARRQQDWADREEEQRERRAAKQKEKKEKKKIRRKKKKSRKKASKKKRKRKKRKRRR